MQTPLNRSIRHGFPELWRRLVRHRDVAENTG